MTTKTTLRALLAKCSHSSCIPPLQQLLDSNVFVDKMKSSLFLVGVILTKGFARQCRWHLGTQAGWERRLALSSFCQYMELLVSFVVIDAYLEQRWWASTTARLGAS